jgi:hypothetical protein
MDHSPPKPPFQCSHPNKKGTILYFFLKSASICILIKTWNYNAAELMGKNWDTDAHAHMTHHWWLSHQAPITGLHNSTLLPFFQSSTDYFMLAQSWKFGVNCCSIGLTHPAACTRALVPLTFGHVHRPRPPFYPNCSKRVPIDWVWAEDFGDILKIQVDFGRGRPKNFGPPPHPSYSYIYQLIALAVKIPII